MHVTEKFIGEDKAVPHVAELDLQYFGPNGWGSDQTTIPLCAMFYFLDIY